MKTINGLTIFTAWRNALSKMQATKHSGQKQWSQYAEYYFSFGMFLAKSQWSSQATGLLLNIVLVKHFQHIKSVRIPYPYFFGFIFSHIQSEGGKSGLEKL